MKIATSLFLIFMSTLCGAVDVFDLHFPNPVKVSDLSRIVYGEILDENFVIEEELLKTDATIVSGLRGLTKKTVDLAFRNVLKQQGFYIDKINGVNFIRKRTGQEDFQIFFYKPKYRSSGYLVDLTSSFLKEGAFSFKRAVQSPAVPAATSPGSGSALPAKTDSGSSAQSNIDKDADSLLFRGPQKEIDQLVKLFAMIDQPQGEIVVKGVVYEVSTKQNEGTAFGLALNVLGGRLGLSAGLSKNLGNAVTLNNAGSFGIDVLVSALSTDSRFKVVSSPNLRVKSGSTAKFSAGSDVPVLGAVQIDRNGNPVQSVEYKPSGVILNISPNVRDGQIELTVNQQLSNFVSTTTGVNNSPTLLKREISTSITAQSDDVVILGGLTEEKTSNDRNGLSFIPEWLYSNGKQDDKSEILLMLQVTRI